MTNPDDVLTCWFGPDADAPFENAHRWWRADPDFDAVIAERFGDSVERAAAGALDDWRETPRGTLALVIVLDQFTRHIHRGTAQAFAQDPLALKTALAAIEGGDDRALTPVECQFLYMPLMHAEDAAVQARSVELFNRLCQAAPPDQRERFEQALTFARKHADIVERFGRFPHRNSVLGRRTTPDERAFLEEHGRGF